MNFTKYDQSNPPLFPVVNTMASRRKPKGSEKISCDFMFDGFLKSNAKGPIINELIKYLLYERQQFPLPFDHVKAELKQVVEKEERTCQVIHFVDHLQLVCSSTCLQGLVTIN